MTRVIRAFIRAWPIVFPALLAWAALATIAPEWFQVRSDIVVAVTNLLLHPATIRILLALTVIWLAVYLRRLEPQDLRRLESRLEALEKRPKPVGDVAPALGRIGAGGIRQHVDVVHRRGPQLAVLQRHHA